MNISNNVSSQVTNFISQVANPQSTATTNPDDIFSLLALTHINNIKSRGLVFNSYKSVDFSNVDSPLLISLCKRLSILEEFLEKITVSLIPSSKLKPKPTNKMVTIVTGHRRKIVSILVDILGNSIDEPEISSTDFVVQLQKVFKSGKETIVISGNNIDTNNNQTVLSIIQYYGYNYQQIIVK